MNEELKVKEVSTSNSQSLTVDARLHDIPHFIQSFSWDCGITCVRMVLSNKQSRQLEQNINLYCTEEYKNQSTWTIDLCYILNHFSIKLKYFTKTIGINPSFGKEKFYDGYIAKDEERVNQRFRSAEKNGIVIQESSIDSEELLMHLQNNGLAIVLTDGNLLDCQHCKTAVSELGNKIKHFFIPSPPYSGHYIVACGYDRCKNLLYYKDPAVKNELCCITFPAFEKARKAHGTDEDIVFIYR